MNTVQCNGIEITLEDPSPFGAELTCREVQEGVFHVDLSVSNGVPAQLPDLKLTWDLPNVDFHYKWNPECMQNRGLDVGLGTAACVKSRANRQAPVYSLYNLDGTNACCMALSDAIHDTVLGGSNANGQIYPCRAVVLGSRMDPVSDYAVTLRLDFRRIPYYETLKDVSVWWEGMSAYAPCKIPQAARMPLLSSWYSYNLRIDPEDWEKQCEMARGYGFDVAILDDGWQTAQLEHGYQNNGDWEVSTEKFPDFAAHVKRVQGMGIKYMVWFSVPFVGVESKAYERFKDMIIPGRDGAKWFGLDPRFPEVRSYLSDTYENFVKTYGIDGLKMDFIGSIGGRDGSEEFHADGHDCKSIGEGVCKLLDDVMERLHAINDEILIEFRQGYIGPAMRKYGNMFRAVDCPNSIGDNRVRTIDVRLICGNTAVHADPTTWHDDDPAPSAAMQLIHTLFSAPQISRKMTSLTPEHTEMVKAYLAMWREHQDVLMCGDLKPLYPHMLYPLVLAENDAKLVAAFYAPIPFVVDTNLPNEVILVNGTFQDHVILDITEGQGEFCAVTTDCLGTVIADESLALNKSMVKVRVPPAGNVKLIRK